MRNLIHGWILLFALAIPAHAYLNAPAEKLTLPELIKEFKCIQMMKAGRVDLEKGVVIWEQAEQIQGESKSKKAKHLLKLKGEVPPALSSLKPDQTAVFFTEDGFGRGVILTDHCWYVVGYEPDHDCWRIAYTDRHYDFNISFAGTPAQLAAAIHTLLKGDEAIVQCRIEPQHEALQTVRYTMKRPKEKVVVGPTTRRAEEKTK